MPTRAELPCSPDEIVAGFRDGSLPRTAWTHEAHLLVGWAAWQELGDEAGAADVLSERIRAYNACSGMPDDRIACHETITRYYVGAVAALDAPDPTHLLVHPWCSRGAPLEHWSTGRLWSAEARQRWVEPDLAPLPWLVGR